MNERDKEIWGKSQQWDSSDDGRGKLKILESVEKFADLIRADEREACAALVDKRLNTWVSLAGKDKAYKWLEKLSAVIRARGNNVSPA